MKRRVCSILLAFCLAVSLITVSSTADGAGGLSVSKTEVKPGDELVLTFSVPGNASKAVGIEVNITFDKEVFEVTSFEPPELSGGARMYSEETDANASGKLTVTYMGAEGDATIDFTGGLTLTAVLKVLDTAPTGEKALEVSKYYAYSLEEDGYTEIDLRTAGNIEKQTVTVAPEDADASPQTPEENDDETESGTEIDPEPEKEKKTFSDVSGHWGEKYIYRAAELSLFKGYPDGSFKPDENVTRAQFVTVLYRYAGSPETDADTPFTDTSSLSEEFRQAIAWAYSRGLINGVSSDRFAPNAFIQRQEAAKILFLLNGGVPGGELLFYSVYDDYYADSDAVSSWAKAPMYWAVYNELITGLPGKRLAPKNYASRAQLAKILINYMEREDNE